MDPEAQTRAATSADSLSSPLIGSPGLFKQQRAWVNDSLSRQSSRSTVASAADFRLPRGFSPQMEESLEHLRELRSWKRFTATRMQVPLALLSGVFLGAAATAAVSLRAQATAAAPPAVEKTPYALQEPPAQVPFQYMISPALNNSCLVPHLAIPEGPQTFDACGFVIRSTDEVWNSRGNVDAAIDKYFHEDYLDAGSWGRRIIGKKALREAIYSEMRAFPDIRIHITDCLCKGNDNDGYKCAMPDVLTGTNTGPSAYGPPTGKFARWTGLVQSFVKFDQKSKQWQYFSEWGVHDEWALIQQLGLDFARVPHPPRNSEPLHDCSPLLRIGSGQPMDADDTAQQQAAARVASYERSMEQRAVAQGASAGKFV